MLELLAQHSWYPRDADPRSAASARYFFRADGTGRYEPATPLELLPHQRSEHLRSQEFRYAFSGSTLRLKFARARGWFETAVVLEPGPNWENQTARFGRHRLRFAKDPYATVLAGAAQADLEWDSDGGAGLP